MNYYVVANDLEHFKKLNDLDVKAIIISSKYSTYRESFSLDEIKSCLELNKDIFVSFYDLISESKLSETILYINELINIGVENFIVNDTGLVFYLSKHSVNVILDNITLNTCSKSINMWKKFNVNGCVCGREITLDEINVICDNSDISIFVHIQGSFPIFSSIRKLLSNYKEAKGVDTLFDETYLYDKDRSNSYRISENDFGTVIFSSYEQCGIEDIDKLKTINFIIDQPNVCSDINIQIVKYYLDYKNHSLNDIQSISEFKQSRGFFYKRTLYKL